MHVNVVYKTHVKCLCAVLAHAEQHICNTEQHKEFENIPEVSPPPTQSTAVQVQSNTLARVDGTQPPRCPGVQYRPPNRHRNVSLQAQAKVKIKLCSYSIQPANVNMILNC